LTHEASCLMKTKIGFRVSMRVSGFRVFGQQLAVGSNTEPQQQQTATTTTLL
jgi:hypothetical protein